MVKSEELTGGTPILRGQIHAQVIATAIRQEWNPSPAPPFGIFKIESDHAIQGFLAIRKVFQSREHPVVLQAGGAIRVLPVSPLIELTEAGRELKLEFLLEYVQVGW